MSTATVTTAPSVAAGNQTASVSPTVTTAPDVLTATIAATATSMPDNSTATPSATLASGAPSATASEPGPGVNVRPLAGHAEATDQTGDVASEDGAAAPGADAFVDLTTVTLAGDGKQLTITFTNAAPRPAAMPAGESAQWYIEIFMHGQKTYEIKLVDGGFTEWITTLTVVGASGGGPLDIHSTSSRL